MLISKGPGIPLHLSSVDYWRHAPSFAPGTIRALIIKGKAIPRIRRIKPVAKVQNPQHLNFNDLFICFLYKIILLILFKDILIEFHNF